jgi:hypothetical protein
LPTSRETVAGVFADLDGDGVEEFVLLTPAGGPVYQKRSAGWEHIGRVYPRRSITTWETLRDSLNNGKLAAAPPEWLDLAVGTERFRVNVAESAFLRTPSQPQ